VVFNRRGEIMRVQETGRHEFPGDAEKNLYAKKVFTEKNGISWTIKRTDYPIIKKIFHQTIGRLLGNEYKHGKELRQLPDAHLVDKNSLKTTSLAFTTKEFSEIGKDVPPPSIEGPSTGQKKEVSIALGEARTDTAARNVYRRVEASWKDMLESRPKLKELNLTALDNILSVGGLNLMIEQLKSKPGMEDAHCFVCDNVEDLKDCMEALKGSSFEGKVAFFVRSANFRGAKSIANHVTPVLVEKKGGETNAMIMDSLGADESDIAGKNGEYYNYVKENVLKNPLLQGGFVNNVYMQLVESATPNMKIYVAKPQRQMDATNCPIFSFNDVKMFLKNKQFFEELNDFGGITEVKDDTDILMVANLPPESMKVAQSFTEIQKYLGENDPGEKISWFRNEGAPRQQTDLEDSLAKGTRENESTGKKMNMKAEDRYYKYLHAIQQVCKAHTDVEVAELSTRYSSVHVTPELLSSLK
jgi:hypothetical protein